MPTDGPALASPALLKRLLQLARSLPQVTVHAEQRHRGFDVRGKRFAWFCDNHHGDGLVGLWCKSTMERQRELIEAGPDRYYRPPYVGPRGWVALRLDTDSLDWDEVTDLLTAAWRLQAPKSLAGDAGPRLRGVRPRGAARPKTFLEAWSIPLAVWKPLPSIPLLHPQTGSSRSSQNSATNRHAATFGSSECGLRDDREDWVTPDKRETFPPVDPGTGSRIFAATTPGGVKKSCGHAAENSPANSFHGDLREESLDPPSVVPESRACRAR